MNHGTGPPPTNPSWHQVSLRFDDYSTAEHIGADHIGPEMTSAEAAGLITLWSFIRKAPCWRLRFLPSHDSTEQDATTFIHQRLDTLRDAGRITSWVETIYEPEMLLSVVDLADGAFIGVVDDWGVRRPRPGVVGGALVGSVPCCSAW